jgi:hypothetical protein
MLLTEYSKDRPTNVMGAIAVALKQMKSVLCYTREIKSSYLNLVSVWGVLKMKEMHAPVEPAKRVVCTVISGKRPFLVLGCRCWISLARRMVWVACWWILQVRNGGWRCWKWNKVNGQGVCSFDLVRSGWRLCVWCGIHND